MIPLRPAPLMEPRATTIRRPETRNDVARRFGRCVHINGSALLRWPIAGHDESVPPNVPTRTEMGRTKHYADHMPSRHGKACHPRAKVKRVEWRRRGGARSALRAQHEKGRKDQGCCAEKSKQIKRPGRDRIVCLTATTIFVHSIDDPSHTSPSLCPLYILLLPDAAHSPFRATDQRLTSRPPRVCELTHTRSGAERTTKHSIASQRPEGCDEATTLAGHHFA